MFPSNRILGYATLVLVAACGGGAATRAGGAGVLAGGAAGEAPPRADVQPPSSPAEDGARKVSTHVTLDAPLFSPSFSSTPVAAVEGHPITFRDFTAALAGARTQPNHADASSPDRAYSQVLERLIDTRLMYVEALAIGLDEDPKYIESLAKYEHDMLDALVRERALDGVEPDPAQVDEIYGDLTRRWKLRSVVFAAEADARAMYAQIRAGADFATAATAWVGTDKGKAGDDEQLVSAEGMLPAVFDVVTKLEPDEVPPPFRIPAGFAVVQVREIVHEDSAEQRAEAERISLELQQQKALRAHYDDLVARYARIDQRALGRLDFEAKRPGFEALEKSTRVLVEIEHSAPITVADLAAKIREDYFHGIGSAIRDKKLNATLQPTIEKLLAKRLFQLEGERARLRETDEFRARVADHRIELLVGFFIRKVVLTGVAVTEGEAMQHYEDHLEDYTYPEFVRLTGLGFDTLRAAHEAHGLLEGGTDWDWIRANADGQTEERARALPSDGKLLTISGLPPALRAALEGAKAGAFRVYAADDGVSYVVQLVERLPPRPQPYLEVRERISKKVLDDKISTAIDTWTAKLREGYDIRRFVVSIDTRPVPAQAARDETSAAAAEPMSPPTGAETPAGSAALNRQR